MLKDFLISFLSFKKKKKKSSLGKVLLASSFYQKWNSCLKEHLTALFFFLSEIKAANQLWM